MGSGGEILQCEGGEIRSKPPAGTVPGDDEPQSSADAAARCLQNGLLRHSRECSSHPVREGWLELHPLVGLEGRGDRLRRWNARGWRQVGLWLHWRPGAVARLLR